MKHFLLGLTLALASLSASADVIASLDGNTVTLHEQGSCSEAISAIAKSRKVPSEVRLMPADVDLNKQEFKACWFVYNGNVHLIYEDGDVGQIPVEQFHKSKDA